MNESSSKITVVSDADASGGQALMWSDNLREASKIVSFSGTDGSQIVVRARGKFYNGAFPFLGVKINGTLVYRQRVPSSSYGDITIPVTVRSGDQITIFGDRINAGVRPLWVDKVRVL
jgi:hypothetical protein